VWFLAGLSFIGAVVQLFWLRSKLWPKLEVVDWFMLVLLLTSPLFNLWHYFRHVREMSEQVLQTGIRLVLGAYVPLWFGFTLLQRVLNG